MRERRSQALRDRREYFQQAADAAASSTVPALPERARAAWSTERFVAAASALRACIIPPLSGSEPAVVPGLERVRAVSSRRRAIAAAAKGGRCAMLTGACVSYRPYSVGKARARACQVRHSRSPTVEIEFKQSGVFQKQRSLVITAKGDTVGGGAMRTDLDPGAIESQVQRAAALCCQARAVLWRVLQPHKDWRSCGAVVRVAAEANVCVQVAITFGQYDMEAPSIGYQLTLPLPPETEDANRDDKADILDLAGLQEETTFTLRRLEPPPDELLAFLRLVNIKGSCCVRRRDGHPLHFPLTSTLPFPMCRGSCRLVSLGDNGLDMRLAGQDAFLMESIFRAEAWEHMMQPVSRENEAAVCEGVVAGCEAALARHAGSPAQTIAALDAAGADRDSENYLALRLRRVRCCLGRLPCACPVARLPQALAASMSMCRPVEAHSS